MMLDRLAGQEQTFGDLGVGEPFAEQSEHLLLTLSQPSDMPRPCPGRVDTQIAHQRGVVRRLNAHFLNHLTLQRGRD